MSKAGGLATPVIRWMAATLDGVVVVNRRRVRGQVHAALVLHRGRAAAEKHMAQLQHNMWVTDAKPPACSRLLPAVASGSSSTIFGRSLYQHLLLTAEKKFWRCVESRQESPRLFGVDPPRATHRGRPHRGHERVQCLGRDLAASFQSHTRPAHLEHETAKAEDFKGSHAGGRQGGRSGMAFGPDAPSRAPSASIS